MSYWNNNVEKLEEVTTDFLPQPWKRWVEQEEIDLYEVPEDLRSSAMMKGTEDHQANLLDHAMSRFKAIKEDGIG